MLLGTGHSIAAMRRRQVSAAAPPVPVSAGAVRVAQYDVSNPAGDATRATLGQGSTRASYSPSSYYPYNRLTKVINQMAAAPGALPDIATLVAGLFVTNGPLWETGFVNGLAGMTTQMNEQGLTQPSAMLLDNASTYTVSVVFALQSCSRRINKGSTAWASILALGPKFVLAHAGGSPA